MTHRIDQTFATLRLAITATIFAGSVILSACSNSEAKSPSTSTILTETIDLALHQNSQIISDCDVSEVLETDGNNIICVSLPSKTETIDPEKLAIDTSRYYADAMISKGWSAPTQWPLVYRFEKPISNECSNVIKLLAWVVDETKAPEDRRFPTSRITFIEKQNPVCGDKRKTK